MAMRFKHAPQRLETESFVLRAWTETDGARLYEAVDASREHLSQMPWAGFYTGEDSADDYVRASRARYLLQESFDLGIWSPDEREVLGATGFHLRGGSTMLLTQTAEIGMWIRASHAGRGLGSAVLGAMIPWAFDTWGWLRIEWRCNTTNLASRGCAERAGMRLEGVLRGEYDDTTGGRRDTACYGLCYGDATERSGPADPRE